MKYTNVAYVGIDWASATHYAYALDASGQKLGHRSFPHSGEGLVELANWIRSVTNLEPGSVAIGIEVPHVRGGNQGEIRIASPKSVPKEQCRCLTQMFSIASLVVPEI
ncbi:IS110 family transposase [Sinorhizobium medicae]|uniref:IS110 family transposase n=1 Tax=Sinorhizobium medicae TaxID=110321 RepID=UPI00041C29A6|nr:transposase [Sinorhizobium medicae]